MIAQKHILKSSCSGSWLWKEIVELLSHFYSKALFTTAKHASEGEEGANRRVEMIKGWK